MNTILNKNNLAIDACLLIYISAVGYVGPGMLTAAVCGNVFASPPTSTIYEAIVCCGKDNPG